MPHASKDKIFKRYTQIDLLIRSQGTGNSKKFAERLGISERALYDNIALMKKWGAPIFYSKVKKSYCYHMEGTFVIGFKPTRYEEKTAVDTFVCNPNIMHTAHELLGKAPAQES